MQSRDRFRKGVVVVTAVVLMSFAARWLLSAGPPSTSSTGGFVPVSSARPYAGSRGNDSRGEYPATAPSQSSGTRAELIVQVAGLVRRPGIYRLPAGSRAYEAIEAAGGAARSGDASALQLAARLVDGVRLVVPQRGSGRLQADPDSSTGVDPQSTSRTGPVSLASATSEQLEALDGVGPALARRIIEWRQAHGGFRSVDDLDRVPGIGPAKFAAIRGSVVP